MAGLPQISSLKSQDPAVTHATRSRRFPGIHVPFLIIIGLLVSYGLVVVYSAVYFDADYSFSRQLAGVAAGVIAMIAVWRFDYRCLSDYTTLFLIINVVLILSPHLPIIGVTSMGATSWIDIGVQIQPGEFAKVTVVLLDASIMARYGGRLDDPLEFLKAVGLMLVPFFCILTQPDLGTGLVYLFIAAVALVVGGARVRFLLISLGLLIACVIAVFAIDEILLEVTGSYQLLQEYQRGRLLVFLDSSYDTDGDGYNQLQAQIAIGSGGLFGKGYMQGTQHSLGILPEAPTDFIFCVLAEEFGFVGAAFLIGLYAALVIVCFQIAKSSNDLFGMMIVLCIVGMWLFQILENIGMDCGLMPITGIPLPFMSYGSSFMVVNFMMLGLVGSVWAHNVSTKH